MKLKDILKENSIDNVKKFIKKYPLNVLKKNPTETFNAPQFKKYTDLLDKLNLEIEIVEYGNEVEINFYGDREELIDSFSVKK